MVKATVASHRSCNEFPPSHAPQQTASLFDHRLTRRMRHSMSHSCRPRPSCLTGPRTGEGDGNATGTPIVLQIGMVYRYIMAGDGTSVVWAGNQWILSEYTTHTRL